MSTTYYRVLHDPRVVDAWFPGFPLAEDGTTIDGRIFTRGLHCENPGRLVLPLEKTGVPLDFTLAAFDMPVLSTRCASLVEKYAPAGAIQRFPVEVDGMGKGYEIVNVTRRVRCLDEQASTIAYMPENRRTASSSPYRWVIDLTIDPARVPSESIFRIEDWTIALIVDDLLREVLSDASGIDFRPVT